MQQIRLIFATATIVAFLSTTCLFGQEKLGSAINGSFVRIDSNQQHGYTMDTEALGKAISGTRIFALGEATHGTRNFVDFRLSMIKKLVLELGYRAIITESDFSSTIAMNDYILNGQGDVRKCLQGMGYWMWNNPDFLRTIEWLRVYNSSAAGENKVQIFGCDMTVPGVIEQILREQQTLKQPLTERSMSGLKILGVWSGRSISKEEKTSLTELSAALNSQLPLYKDTSFFKQSLKTILQVVSFRLMGPGKNQSAIRDKAMFDNINWIYNIGRQGKVIFLAHNLHISKKSILSGWENVGSLLHKAYGSKYYSLGLVFSKGAFRAQDRVSGKSKVFSVDSNRRSLEFALHNSTMPNFYLDFSFAKNIDVPGEFFNKAQPMRAVGALFSNSKSDDAASLVVAVPSEAFDGIAFFKETFATDPSFGWKKYE